MRRTAVINEDVLDAKAAVLAPQVMPIRDADGKWTGDWLVPSQSGGAPYTVRSHGWRIESWHRWTCGCQFAQVHAPGEGGHKACAHVRAARDAWRIAADERSLDRYTKWLGQVGEVVDRGTPPYVWVRGSTGEVVKLVDCTADDWRHAGRLMQRYAAMGPEYGAQVIALRALRQAMPCNVERNPMTEEV